MGVRPTRGNGLLEPFLARQRRRLAHAKLASADKADGWILDAGCGTFPQFLVESDFRHRVGIERSREVGKEVKPSGGGELHFACFDLAQPGGLPFRDACFDAITCLAVIEHIDPGRTHAIFADFHRILRPGGCLVLTTPAAWTDGLLRFLARIGLTSPEEIKEHVNLFSRRKMLESLIAAGFSKSEIEIGHFECGMNLWACAVRRPE